MQEPSTPWEVRPPLLVIASETVIFEDVSRLQPRVQVVSVRNAGEAPLRLERARLAEGSEDDAREFQVDLGQWANELTLAGGQTAQIAITYAPVNDITDTAQLLFETNDAFSPEASIRLLGVPERLEPEIELPETLEMPALGPLDYSSQVRFEIQNTGSGRLALDRVFSDNPRELIVRFPDPQAPEDQDRDRLVFPSFLSPGERLPVRLIYQPDDVGSDVYSVTVRSGDADEPTSVIKVSASKGGDGTCVPVIARARADGRVWDFRAEGTTLETGHRVELTGVDTESFGVNVERWRWRMVGQPEGSREMMFLPGNDVATTTIQLTEPGRYLFDLNVVDDQGRAACELARVPVQVGDGVEEILARVEWDLQEQDIELFYKASADPWRDSTRVVSEASPVVQMDDARSVARLRREGATQTVRHETRDIAGVFDVGAYHKGLEDVTVRVVVYGEGARELGSMTRRLRPGEFWHAGQIKWPQGEFEEVGRLIDLDEGP